MFLKSFERSLSYTSVLRQAAKPCAYFSRWRRPRQNQKANPDRNSSSNKDSLLNRARYSQPEGPPKDQDKVSQFSNLEQDFYDKIMKPKPKSIYEEDESSYEKLHGDYLSMKDFILLKMSDSFKDLINKPSHLKNTIEEAPLALSGTERLVVGKYLGSWASLKLLHSKRDFSSSKSSQSRIYLFLLLSILFFMFLERNHGRKNSDRSEIGGKDGCRRAFYFLPAPLLYLLLEEEKKRKKKIMIGLRPCLSPDFENFLMPKYLKEPLKEVPNESPKFPNFDSDNHFFLKYFEKPVKTTRTEPFEPSAFSEDQTARKDDKEPVEKKKNKSSNKTSVNSSNTGDTDTGSDAALYVAGGAVALAVGGLAWILCPPLSVPLMVAYSTTPPASYVALAAFGRGFLGV